MAVTVENPKKGVGRPVGGASSAADRVAAAVARHNQVARRRCADPARRAKLEADPPEWLKWYLAGTYSRPFETPHVGIIRGVMRAHEMLSRFVVAGERGIGKSVMLWGMVLYLALTGRERFPVCVPWHDKALKRAFRFWKTALCFNDRLAADYPEYCAPFRHARGIPQRVMNTTWEDTGMPTGAQLTVGEGMIVLPDRLGCLGGATINGNIRGLNHPQEDGAVLRPSIVMLDDIQDRGVAKSPNQVEDTIAIIDGDVAGCGDAGRDLPMLMACNCIGPRDVAEHYLNSSEWHALRVPCVEKWPDKWEDDSSRVRALWDEWHERFVAGRGDRTFYRKNRAAMIKGMVLSAPGVFKGASKCPDAFYGVIRMYYRMGHEAFMAERQQQPIDPVSEAGPYTITPLVVMSRITKREYFERPDWVTTVLATTDVNPSYALSTVLLGFGADQSAAVLWYGLHKMHIARDVTTEELKRKLFDELQAHGKELAGMPVVPEFWAIDGGGANFDGVIRFAGESARVCGVPAAAFTGRGFDKYNEYGKTFLKGQPRREMCHVRADVKDGRHIRWIPWQTDYWKEVMQRACLGDVGAPGAMSLPKGYHNEFATQICASKLIAKGEFGGKMAWKWHEVPGKRDFHDAMGQGYAAAAYLGIGTSGQVVLRKRKKYTQKDLQR